MRIPRSLQLFNSQGFVHQFWRCHNKEFYLGAAKIKSLYLNCIKRALKSHNKDGSLKIYAFTVMDNHFHNLMDYQSGSGKLSAFLRQAHSLFGATFNRWHKRSGKVAEGRPKTSLIENIEHLMRVHFYIEANPIRAARCTINQLRFYKHSSYSTLTESRMNSQKYFRCLSGINNLVRLDSSDSIATEPSFKNIYQASSRD
jgi:REP element-mobilizing transposase RayT